jgi:23S rRNA maturation-related 3'-5' exoribonuclease YhaM
MKQMKISNESIMGNYERINGLIDMMGDKNKNIKKMMDVIGDRFLTAPASFRVTCHNCCVGGLADHSLRVYNNMVTLAKSFGEDLDRDSIILVALFHDLGKVGSLSQDYYIPQDSTWHQDKLGEYYLANDKLVYMKTNQLVLLLVQSGHLIPIVQIHLHIN